MIKQQKIDYRKELELVMKADDIIEVINGTMGELSQRYANRFLSGVERALRKESKHWLRMAKIKHISPVYDDIRKRLSRKHLKEGEFVPVEDLATLFHYTPYSTLRALLRLESVLDFKLIKTGRWRGYYPNETYLLMPVSEQSYRNRIPVNGKPELDSEPRQQDYRLLIRSGSITKDQAVKLGIDGPTHGDYYNEFGLNPAVSRECMRQLAAEVRERGYCWKNKGQNQWNRLNPYITPEEAEIIFKSFLEKTGLPIGSINDKPVLVYHPKLIRRHRKN